MFKPLLLVLMIASSVFTANVAHARNTPHELSAKDALQSPLGREKISIPMYMKGQRHPYVKQRLGEYKSNKRTSGFGKSDEVACERAFVSALMSLQKRAQKVGADAVVDIWSITQDVPYENAVNYRCVAGSIVVNVALKGTMARLK